jgi:hypothetical protein
MGATTIDASWSLASRVQDRLFVNLLNAHSRVLAFGELFRSPETIGWDTAPFNTSRSAKLLALYRADPVAFIGECIFRRWPRGWGAVGFKLFYYHARQLPYSSVWDYLAANRDIRILHIRRRNLLKQYYSLERAHKTNVWASSKADWTSHHAFAWRSMPAAGTSRGCEASRMIARSASKRTK